MAKSTLSAKGLTTVPKDVREALGLREGDVLEWEVVDAERRQVLVTARRAPYAALKGKYNDPELTYLKVEGLADELIRREVGASDRA